MTKKILHYPRLDTILMIEEAVKKSRNKGKMQIWRSLPKKIMYQTFNLVLSYLESSGKILIRKGKILWIHDPQVMKKLVEYGYSE
ncbi:MAG: hypothetical protein HYT72_05240 [Candidatus Aenigmarchaeota archaeon]|nr:hypothetical protein [Candidatus Aenigmarchaeota archaeon]